MSHFRNQRGVTYLMLMFSIVLIGLAVSVAAKQWKTVVQRELEADLLARGIEIQWALMLYDGCMKSTSCLGHTRPPKDGAYYYPRTLKELAKTPRPFLRKAYTDPITRGDWDYIRGPKGGIKGVRSRSTETPIKQSGFPPDVRHFEGLARYQDWLFQYPNPSTPQQPATAPGQQTPPPPPPAGRPSTGSTPTQPPK